MTILAFGQIADIVSENELALVSADNTEALRIKLAELFPALLTMKFQLAVDKKIAGKKTPLTDKSIVALLPPFSGG